MFGGDSVDLGSVLLTRQHLHLGRLRGKWEQNWHGGKGNGSDCLGLHCHPERSMWNLWELTARSPGDVQPRGLWS